jgi:hypothetical protein
LTSSNCEGAALDPCGRLDERRNRNRAAEHPPPGAASMQGLFSRLLGVALLVAAAPTFALAALAVRLGSKGPILCRCARIDDAGRRFAVWAFRVHASSDDGTISGQFTAIGRLLWWTRIDELPQEPRAFRSVAQRAQQPAGGSRSAARQPWRAAGNRCGPASARTVCAVPSRLRDSDAAGVYPSDAMISR